MVNGLYIIGQILIIYGVNKNEGDDLGGKNIEIDHMGGAIYVYGVRYSISSR